MSEGEYAHKFSVGAVPGKKELPDYFQEEDYVTLDNAVRKSGYEGNFFVHFVNEVGDPPYTGFEIEFQKLPTPEQMKNLGKLNLKKIKL